MDEKAKENAKAAAAIFAKLVGATPDESFEWCNKMREAAQRCGWPDLETATQEEIANAIYAVLHEHRNLFPERASFERILTRALTAAFMEDRVTQNRAHMAKHAHLWFNSQILGEMNAAMAAAEAFIEALFPETPND